MTIDELLEELNNYKPRTPMELIHIGQRQMAMILDYITNLQQKIEHYEKTQTFGDYVKEVNLLVDKDNEIKQLQEDIVNHIKIASEYKEQTIIKDNIINELEKDLQSKIDKDRLNLISNPHWLYVLDKLKELKENK